MDWFLRFGCGSVDIPWTTVNNAHFDYFIRSHRRDEHLNYLRKKRSSLSDRHVRKHQRDEPAHIWHFSHRHHQSPILHRWLANQPRQLLSTARKEKTIRERCEHGGAVNWLFRQQLSYDHNHRWHSVQSQGLYCGRLGVRIGEDLADNRTIPWRSSNELYRWWTRLWVGWDWSQRYRVIERHVGRPAGCCQNEPWEAKGHELWSSPSFSEESHCPLGKRRDASQYSDRRFTLLRRTPVISQSRKVLESPELRHARTTEHPLTKWKSRMTYRDGDVSTGMWSCRWCACKMARDIVLRFWMSGFYLQ